MTLDEFKYIIRERLSEAAGFSIDYSVPLLSEAWKKSDADIVITNSEDQVHHNFAVLVATSKSSAQSISVRYAKAVVAKMVSDHGFWIGLIWDNGELQAYNPSVADKNKLWNKISVDDLLNSATDFLNSKIPHTFIKQLRNSFREIKGRNDMEKRILSVLIQWCGRLKYEDLSQQERTVSISLVNQLNLIKEIIGNRETEAVRKYCRYSSVSALKRIILDGNESMCGLAGMNDKSEGFFLDKCLKGDSYNLFRKPPGIIDRYNEMFILSLCPESRSDDLTMWRLYGSDSRGVCLHYDADMTEFSDSQEFFLIPICYGNEDNPLVLLFKVLDRLPYINGLRFGLTHAYIWRYFVKPADFSVEEEYRLLYIPKSEEAASNLKWIHNEASGTFHPLCEFKSRMIKKDSHFPLRLKKVILGPKYEEAQVNKVQLKSYLRTSKSLVYRDVDVELSKLDFYR